MWEYGGENVKKSCFSHHAALFFLKTEQKRHRECLNSHYLCYFVKRSRTPIQQTKLKLEQKVDLVTSKDVHFIFEGLLVASFLSEKYSSFNRFFIFPRSLGRNLTGGEMSSCSSSRMHVTYIYCIRSRIHRWKFQASRRKLFVFFGGRVTVAYV